MKTCPYCAEHIQDAAIVCKHCNRDLAKPSQKGRTSLFGALVGGGLLLALLIAFVARPAAKPQLPPLPKQQGSPRPAPVTTEVVNSNSVAIPAGQYVQYSFKIARSDCRISGRIEGVEGGQKEVEVRVLTADDFINWKNQPNVDQFGLFKSPRETVTSLDVTLPHPGEWVLVVSNHWASWVGKTALVHASITCG